MHEGELDGGLVVAVDLLGGVGQRGGGQLVDGDGMVGHALGAEDGLGDSGEALVALGLAPLSGTGCDGGHGVGGGEVLREVVGVPAVGAAVDVSGLGAGADGGQGDVGHAVVVLLVGLVEGVVERDGELVTGVDLGLDKRVVDHDARGHEDVLDKVRLVLVVGEENVLVEREGLVGHVEFASHLMPF